VTVTREKSDAQAKSLEWRVRNKFEILQFILSQTVWASRGRGSRVENRKSNSSWPIAKRTQTRPLVSLRKVIKKDFNFEECLFDPSTSSTGNQNSPLSMSLPTLQLMVAGGQKLRG